jgi:hypothetical protein
MLVPPWHRERGREGERERERERERGTERGRERETERERARVGRRLEGHLSDRHTRRGRAEHNPLGKFKPKPYLLLTHKRGAEARKAGESQKVVAAEAGYVAARFQLASDSPHQDIVAGL